MLTVIVEPAIIVVSGHEELMKIWARAKDTKSAVAVEDLRSCIFERWRSERNSPVLIDSGNSVRPE